MLLREGIILDWVALQPILLEKVCFASFVQSTSFVQVCLPISRYHWKTAVSLLQRLQTSRTAHRCNGEITAATRDECCLGVFRSVTGDVFRAHNFYCVIHVQRNSSVCQVFLALSTLLVHCCTSTSLVWGTWGNHKY